MRIYHLTLAVRGRRALARDEAERRLLMRAIARTCGASLLLPGVADDHLHAVIRTLRPGYLARDLARVLGNRRPDLTFKPPHFALVDTRAYLAWLVRYLLEQPAKHGLPGPAALWTGCCFQDLVGARLLPGFSAAGLANELPRMRLRELFPVVGLRSEPLVPLDDAAIRHAGAGRLVDAAGAVFAVGPALDRRIRSAGVLEARRLTVRVARRVGLPAQEVAHYLGVKPKAVSRLWDQPCPEFWIAALRRRLALEDRAGQPAPV